MLSSASLIRHAAERGMPAGKIRGAVREYLQVVVLKALYGQARAEGLVFLGGTALRLAHDLPRFSEDLDFDAQDLALAGWKGLVEAAAHSLARYGFSIEVRTGERGGLLTGDLRFSGLLQAYQLAAEGEKLRVKVEANRPAYPLMSEPRVISAYGETAAVVFAAPELMAAEKILALLGRELGRDVYDLFFISGRRWRPDERVLAAKGVAEPVRAVLDRVQAWGRPKLSAMARRLEPFLFQPEDARLVAEARRLLPSALEYLG